MDFILGVIIGGISGVGICELIKWFLYKTIDCGDCIFIEFEEEEEDD